MEFFGNIFTHYNYTTTDIFLGKKEDQLEVASKHSNFRVVVQLDNEEIDLPEHSPFASWKEARRFAGPLPFTFTYNEETKKILIIEGVRKDWKPKPVSILDYQISFLDQLPIKNPILANAFVINDIPYYWKKGKSEQWNP